MAKIVHVSDLHFGIKYDFLPVDKQSSAIRMQYSALDDLVNFTNDSKADVLLIAGDLFDTPNPDKTIAKKVFDILGKVLCPIFISPGNHDYISSDSPFNSAFLPSNITVFKTRLLSSVSLNDNTIIYGAAFESNNCQMDITAKLDPLKTNILLIHSDIQGQSGYNPLSVTDIEKSNYDYIATGHNHSFNGLKKVENTYFANTGSFCATLVNETGKKGYLAGEVSKSRCNLSFVTSTAFTIVPIDINISDIFTDNQLSESFAKNNIYSKQNICAFVTLSGAKQFEYDRTLIAQNLGSNYFHYIFRDQSTSHSDIWSNISDPGLLGDVTRIYKNMYENAKETRKEQILLSAQYAIDALTDN